MTAHSSRGLPGSSQPVPGTSDGPPPDILLVEDSPGDVELTVRALRQLDPDTRIDIARDGEEALDFLLGRGGFRHRFGTSLPRLVLLDLMLPKLDGLEVLRGVRSNARTCMAPVVILTSSTDPRQLAQCYQLGANSYVQKPVKYEDFLHVIQTLGRYWLGLNQAPPVPFGADGLDANLTLPTAKPRR